MHMHKHVALVTVLLLASASGVSADSYYPSMYVGSVGSCTTISRDLSYGSRGSDVTTLQSFLVNRDYPGGGSWMISGYFGRATRQAVRNFQAEESLPVTGVVNAATRAAISRVSCGGTVNTPFSFTYPYVQDVYQTYPLSNPPYYTPTTSLFPVNCGAYSIVYGYNTSCPTMTPTITYLSPASGGIGERITVYGSGLSATGNTVRFGNGIITNLISPDGQSVSFTVPAHISGYGSQPVAIGTYQISVSNASGATSNTLPFSVTSLGAASAPTITGVTGPTTINSGVQGSWTVTFYNPGATYANVSVRWGDESTYAYAAVPQTVYGNGTQTATFTHAYAQGGTYSPTFTVTNTNGQSNSTSLTVAVSGAAYYGNTSLTYLSPMSGRVGTQVVLQGTGFTPLENTVRFGVGGTQHLPSQNGTQIYYTIPAYVSQCDTMSVGYACTLLAQQITPGTYPVYVTNANGTTQTLTFTVVQ